VDLYDKHLVTRPQGAFFYNMHATAVDKGCRISLCYRICFVVFAVLYYLIQLSAALLNKTLI